MSSILIIDDNEEILLALRLFLQNHFSRIDTDTRPDSIPTYLESQSYDVIVLDMNFQTGVNNGNEGIYWMRRVFEIDPLAVIVFITAYGDVQLAVKAIQEGATDFIEKPWDENRLLVTLLKAKDTRLSRMEIGRLKRKQKHLNDQIEESFNLVRGESPAMKQVWHTVEKAAPTDANVIILGENGTGKEIVARQIHRLSKRHKDIFVNVDMGAITPTLFESEMFGHCKGAFTGAIEDRAGRFEVASGGTLFLDEIGNLTLEQQAKLLAVLQNRQVTPVGGSHAISFDVRLVSATNRDLYDMVAKGQFREDLLYRLNTIRLELPPLRERVEEIPQLADFFMNKYARKYNREGLMLGRSGLRLLNNYSWPGNVRELQNTLEKAVILCEGSVLNGDDFQIRNSSQENYSGDKLTTGLNLEDNERELIRRAIDKTRGNYSQAVRELGISRKTLYNKIKKYGL